MLTSAGDEMAREEHKAFVRESATANIDATTKVVIPHAVSMAVA